MRRRKWFTLLLIIAVIIILLGAFVFLLLNRWRADWCKASAMRVSLSLQNYRDAHDGCLPPPFIEDKDTGQRHSWRAMLLPYLTSPSVWERYSFQESWNSPQNREFLTFGEYACSAHSKSPEMTNYVAVTGENTLWPTPKKPWMRPPIVGRRVRPRWPNTIVLVELVESDIPWTEPRDVTLDEFLNTIKTNPKGRFYNKYIKGIRAIDASGQLHVIDPYDNIDEIREMFVVPSKNTESSANTREEKVGQDSPNNSGDTSEELKQTELVFPKDNNLSNDTPKKKPK